MESYSSYPFQEKHFESSIGGKEGLEKVDTGEADVLQYVYNPESLFGEMVDNRIMTRAAEEVQRADVLLVLGTNLKSYLCTQLVTYYDGDKLVLVNAVPHFSDRLADISINDRVDNTLEKILKELGD